MRLYSYIIAVDDGFAPCATRSICTLACCKPKIRAKAKAGHWVMGTTPKKNGSGKLVYLMQVDRALGFADYYHDARLRSRKDCIYRPLASGRFRQKENPWHNGHAIKRKDLSGKYVLLAKRFVYFGDNAPSIPSRWRGYVARGQGHRVWGTPGTPAPNTIRHGTLNSLTRWALSKGRGVCGKPLHPQAIKHTDCNH